MEELLPRFGDCFRWPAFYDVPAGQTVTQELLEAPGSRQDHVIGEPFGLLAEPARKRPVCNEAWVCCLPLYAMQGAMFLGQQGYLRSGHGHRVELPGPCCRRDGEDAFHACVYVLAI